MLTVRCGAAANRAMLDWHFAPTSRKGEVMTDMPFPLYPPGMYQASMRRRSRCSRQSDTWIILYTHRAVLFGSSRRARRLRVKVILAAQCATIRTLEAVVETRQILRARFLVRAQTDTKASVLRLVWTLSPFKRPAETRALQGIAEMSQLGVPIWITETGCCDHTTLKRPAFFHSYLDQVAAARFKTYGVLLTCDAQLV